MSQTFPDFAGRNTIEFIHVFIYCSIVALHLSLSISDPKKLCHYYTVWSIHAKNITNMLFLVNSKNMPACMDIVLNTWMLMICGIHWSGILKCQRHLTLIRIEKIKLCAPFSLSIIWFTCPSSLVRSIKSIHSICWLLLLPPTLSLLPSIKGSIQADLPFHGENMKTKKLFKNYKDNVSTISYNHWIVKDVWRHLSKQA